MTMLIIKTLHVFFVVSWFAGLFYLPRIFVNLAATDTQSDAYGRLLLMSDKLYRFMGILSVGVYVFGLWLMLIYGIGQGQGWIHAKLTLVLALTFYQIYCGRLLKRFHAKQNQRSHIWYRWFNEVPALCLLLILALVILKPF